MSYKWSKLTNKKMRVYRYLFESRFYMIVVAIGLAKFLANAIKLIITRELGYKEWCIRTLTC